MGRRRSLAPYGRSFTPLCPLHPGFIQPPGIQPARPGRRATRALPIAGIGVALVEERFASAAQRVSAWAETSNPFSSGPYADALSLIPFAVLCLMLFGAARG